MNHADTLVAKWAADRYGKSYNYTFDDVETIRFEPWVGCYSEYTHDYGINPQIVLKDGRVVETVDWHMPETLREMDKYKAAEDKLTEMHDEQCPA